MVCLLQFSQLYQRIQPVRFRGLVAIPLFLCFPHRDFVVTFGANRLDLILLLPSNGGHINLVTFFMRSCKADVDYPMRI